MDFYCKSCSTRRSIELKRTPRDRKYPVCKFCLEKRLEREIAIESDRRKGMLQ